MSLSIYGSVSLPTVSLCLCLYFNASLLMSVFVYVFISMHLWWCLSIFVTSVSLERLYLCWCLSIFVQVCICVMFVSLQRLYLCWCLSIFVNVCLSVCLSLITSVSLERLSIFVHVCLSVCHTDIPIPIVQSTFSKLHLQSFFFGRNCCLWRHFCCCLWQRQSEQK